MNNHKLSPVRSSSYTHTAYFVAAIQAHIKLKEPFENANGAIQAYQSLSDQVDPFWLPSENHLREQVGPKQLHLKPYQQRASYSEPTVCSLILRNGFSQISL